MVTQKLKRPLYALSAGVLAAVSLVPLLTSRTAHAYGLVTARSIKLSSSAQAATDVTYSTSFTIATTSNVGGMVVDVCSNSPIIGDSCTAPTGFKWHAKTGDNTLVLANQAGITDFAKDPTNTTDNKIVLTRTAASVSA